MVNNEWDDILYWEDYEPFRKLTQELDRKYYTYGMTSTTHPHQYDCWQKERDAYYKHTIPNKEEFIRRFQYYEHHGKPQWVEGHHKTMNEITEEELLRSFYKVSKENGIHHVEISEKARLGWAAQHLSHYAEKICETTNKEHKIMEMTVGAGVGTNAIVRSITDKMFYIGVDIDFLCAKNADAIGRYYGKNAIGICSSLWNLPFSDNLFDVVCSHFGFDECREIPTILKEAVRVLKPGGRFISVSRHNIWLRRHEIFEKYDIGEKEALELMRKARLYTDFEQFDALAGEMGLVKIDYIPYENWYLVEYIYADNSKN